MKRTIIPLLVAGLFAGIGTSAIAEDVKAGTEPKADSSAMAPPDTDVTGQRPAMSPKRTDPAKEDAALAKDLAGNSSDQPKKTKDY